MTMKVENMNIKKKDDARHDKQNKANADHNRQQNRHRKIFPKRSRVPQHG